MDPIREHELLETRRQFFGRCAGFYGIGALGLGSLMRDDREINAAHPSFPNFHPRAKRVIYLFQSGAPSQMDLLDYKPSLDELDGTELPGSIRMGQRLTGMTSRQKNFTVTKSPCIGTTLGTRTRRVVRGGEVGPKGESRRALACCRGIADVVARLFHLVFLARPTSLPISSRSTGSRLVSTGETRMKEPQGSGHTTSLHTRAQTTGTTNASSNRKNSAGNRGRQQPPVLLGKGRRPPGGLLGASLSWRRRQQHAEHSLVRVGLARARSGCMQ